MNNPTELAHAGLMGHPFVVTDADTKGNRRLCAEMNTLEDAKQHAATCLKGKVYGRKGINWEEIT